jgi:hypothetical protein
MEKITCNVVRDLLPLYVDDVLSDDSRKLVEEHMRTCNKCRSYYDEMTDDSVPVAAKMAKDDKAALKDIKKKLVSKKICTICVTFLTVAMLAAGLYYLLFCKESYVAYEDTGIYAEGNCLYTKKPYNCYYGYWDEDDNNLYIYVSTTFYESHRQPGKAICLEDLSDNGTDFDKVYYVPEQDVECLRNFDRARLNSNKDSYTLVWSAE